MATCSFLMKGSRGAGTELCSLGTATGPREWRGAGAGEGQTGYEENVLHRGWSST